MVVQNLDLDEIRDYISKHPKAIIFFGCDSQRFKTNKEWYSRLVTAVVVYEKDSNKVYGEISIEKDYDSNPSRPALRMMAEVYKVSAVVLELEDVLVDRTFEIHLDINKNILHGSSVALQQAIGFIKMLHNVEPKVKPDAWCASKVADHLVRTKQALKFKHSYGNGNENKNKNKKQK